MIYILEDNQERVTQFRAAAAAIAPDLPIRFWRSAHLMTADLVDALELASIMSLDHDGRGRLFWQDSGSTTSYSLSWYSGRGLG